MAGPVEVEKLLSGFPGRADRGFFGWSNVYLLKGERLALFDTGFYTDRAELLIELEKRSIAPGDIDMVILSHLHYDHCINLALIPGAEVLLSPRELEYARGECREKGDIYIVDYPDSLLAGRTLRLAEEGTLVMDGVVLMETPGHTPGCISAVAETPDGPVVLAGDAIKNGWEVMNNTPTMAFVGIDMARKSMKRILDTGGIIIPGHDRAFVYRNGGLEYLEELGVVLEVREDPSGPPKKYRIP
ncbi:MAG TPA: MBL fold metallo-hydrolase [Firmicutes bacterium]|nr:MBL fold metallo-hydrolase [Bacillota bacterium]